MTLNDCTIVFDSRPNAIYFCGETVSGTVNLEINKNKKCQALMLKICGKAKCKWSEYVGRGKEKKFTHFSGEEVYFETNNNLLADQPMNDGAYDLAVGKYSFRFSCDLPHRLPSSMESENGHVRCMVKVTMNRSLKFDLSYALLFTVLSPVDLNLIPGIQSPAKNESSQTLYCLCFPKGMMRMIIQLPYGGYVPGQPMMIKCSLVNDSSVRVKSVTLSLIKNITCTAHYPYSKVTTQGITVNSCEIDGCNGNDSITTETTMEVPPLPPSTMNMMTIVNVSYEFKAIAHTAGMHTNLTCKIPITIGTIPVNNRSQTNAQPTAPSAPPTDYSDLPPPSYQDAVTSVTAEKDDEDTKFDPYKPKYPLYDFNALKTMN